MLSGVGEKFGIMMTFLVMGIFVVIALAYGYDLGWATALDSWGMELDVIFTTIAFIFLVVGMFVAIFRR